MSLLAVMYFRLANSQLFQSSSSTNGKKYLIIIYKYLKFPDAN